MKKNHSSQAIPLAVSLPIRANRRRLRGRIALAAALGLIAGSLCGCDGASAAQTPSPVSTSDASSDLAQATREVLNGLRVKDLAALSKHMSESSRRHLSDPDRMDDMWEEGGRFESALAWNGEILGVRYPRPDQAVEDDLAWVGYARSSDDRVSVLAFRKDQGRWVVADLYSVATSTFESASATPPRLDMSKRVAEKPAVPKYALSTKANEIKGLLDRGAWTGADRLFASYLDAAPADAGLLAQYARFIILSQPLTGDKYILTPLVKQDLYLSAAALGDSIGAAGDIDPEIRNYLAGVILESLEQAVAKTLDAGSGVVGPGVAFIASGIECTLINAGWRALELNPAIGPEWAPHFEVLAARAASMGKVSTAMMLGNLAGDLSQAGQGGADFRLANKYFLQAIQASSPIDDEMRGFIRRNMEAYPTMFKEELAAVARETLKDANYDEIREIVKQFR